MIQFNLILEKRYYFPNDLVNGKIILKSKTSVNIELLQLKIKKLQILNFEKIKKNENFLILKKNPKIKKEKNEIIIKKIELCAGEHEFPFIFYIPNNEGASNSFYGVLNDFMCYFKNNTIIEIICKYNQKNIKTSYPLIIYNKTENSSFLNIKIKINQIICFNISNYYYKIITDKSFYYGGENVCITFCPLNKIKKKIISEINASIYEIFIIGPENNNIVRSRFVCENKMIKINENEFKGKIKLPFFICGTFTENNFTIRIVIFSKIKLINGEILRIKKTINVGRTKIIIPNIEEKSLFESIVHEMKIIEYH